MMMMMIEEKDGDYCACCEWIYEIEMWPFNATLSITDLIHSIFKAHQAIQW